MEGVEEIPTELRQRSPAYLALNSGNDSNKLSQNSSYQLEGMDHVKAMIDEAVMENLDMMVVSSSSSSSSTFPLSGNIFFIADLGCSVGPSTFTAVQTVLDAVKQKFKSKGLSKLPEFLVFFNDRLENDFNMLFSSLPCERTYFAVAAPGSFHGRLFPEGSIHFFHSYYSLHFLSRVPPGVENKGRIIYSNASEDVVNKAYSEQFNRDIECFLCARAKELVVGGLMALLFPICSDGSHPFSLLFDPLGSCLMDMVDEGIIEEAKVDSFNIPIFSPTMEDFKMLVNRNGCFNIERIEIIYMLSKSGRRFQVKSFCLHIRAWWEGIISKHFGDEIINDLFDRYLTKLEESTKSYRATNGQLPELFAILKRKATD